MNTADPTYRALLAGVLAEPADDNARLVLADWLQGEGEDERAEFIRSYVALPNGMATFGSGDLVRGHGRPWMRVELNALPFTGPWEVKYRRGFISSVTCTASDWLTHADAILAAHPIQRVTLTTTPGRLHRFTAGGVRHANWILPAEWTDSGTAYGIEANARTADRIRAELELKWEGITFEVPAPNFWSGTVGPVRTTVIAVAPGQSIRAGDLVGVNAQGQAVPWGGTAAGNFTATAIDLATFEAVITPVPGSAPSNTDN